MQNLNPHLQELQPDFLYHLGLDSGMDLEGMFGDVKYVCMAGSAKRAEVFARQLAESLGLPHGEEDIKPIGKTERTSMYKVGPVLSLSHGMGMPSLSIFLSEVTKLLHYAGVQDPIYLRLGTSGGIGVAPGTIVVATEGLNEKLEPAHEKIVLGEERRYPTSLDAELNRRIMDVRRDIAAVSGKTVGTNDFYEGQGRLDGALDPGYTETDKMAFLNKAHTLGARNYEMEAPEFAAFCLRAGIRGAILCTALLNRLEGDQVTSTPAQLAEYSDNVHRLAIQFIKSELQPAS